METSLPELPLKEFKCQRCNECCRQPGFVYLTEAEADRIATHLKMDSFEFINDYCNLQDRRKLVLKKRPDESCIFLDHEGCTIHEAKPNQCATFPRGWRTKKSFEYCEGLKVLGVSNA